ncbi:ribosomal protein L4/L1e [Thermodesulfobium narugense DSM 14796]|uniref:Large ribosomal subunit protein uL4 n=1 Tax=Thermodesulfobium narugense DSM 14796 TaxID=747365 RepID=M1E6R1_9BACT|nr:50S ribosomal protein L4 [Thermodesulfobium narugense]AEE14145.1 ribosomal protein L4/L1e [Thermodesulfobium narugense DSM 14796]
MISVYDLEGNKVKEIESNLTGIKDNSHVVYMQVVRELAGMRSGSACTKTRGEVRGGGKKPYAQKHTGRARHGSIRSPIWRKGGITFGPKPRKYSFSLPKKVIKLSRNIALKNLIDQDRFIVVENLSNIEPKAKFASNFVKKLPGENCKSLIVIDDYFENVMRAFANLPNFKIVDVNNLKVADILWSQRVILTPEALECLETWR